MGAGLVRDVPDGQADARPEDDGDGPEHACGRQTRAGGQGRDKLDAYRLETIRLQLELFDVTDSSHVRIHIEMPEVFSSISLDRWSMIYSQEYAYVDSETFATSLSGLGLTSLPDRTLIVPTGKFMRVPPQHSRDRWQFAGHDHRLAVTPSLKWLMANHSRDVPGNRIVRAWIPWTGDDAAPLSLLREARRCACKP